MNNIISEWMGEKKLSVIGWAAGIYVYNCPTCKRHIDTAAKLTECIRPDCKLPDYTDPTAWDERIYNKIEEAGLWQKFLDNLIPTCWADCPMGMKCNYVDWLQFKATPLQKSQALVRAIKESEGKR